MRILLLSCNTGGGHNSAAAAIQNYCKKVGVDCDIHDALRFVSKPHTKIVSGGHSFVYRHLPRLFGAGYRYEEKHPPHFIYNQMSLGAKKFAAFLGENHYDAIVCTHIFGNMLVTDVRKRFGVTIPHFAVNTDYSLYPGADMVDPQRFFIAAEQLRAIHVSAGLLNDRLIVSGIPIREDFFREIDKKDARNNLNLPEKKKIVLLFSGSIGCGKLHKKAPALAKQLPEDAHLVIICGHNTNLYKRLQKARLSNTTVVGYTDRIAEFMAASDLCVTKPGGLSTTEMLVMGLPMVLMLSVPGCETRNLEHFESLNVAVGTEDWDEAIRLTIELIQDDDRLAEMKERLRNIEYPGGAKVIIDTVLSDLEQQEQPKND